MSDCERCDALRAENEKWRERVNSEHEALQECMEHEVRLAAERDRLRRGVQAVERLCDKRERYLLGEAVPSSLPVVWIRDVRAALEKDGDGRTVNIESDLYLAPETRCGMYGHVRVGHQLLGYACARCGQLDAAWEQREDGGWYPPVPTKEGGE